MEATIEQPNSNNKLRILIIAVFLLLVLGLGGYLFYIYSGQNAQVANEQNNTQNTTNTTTDSEVNQETDMPAGVEGNRPGTADQNQPPAQPQNTPEPTDIPPIDETKPWLKVETQTGETTATTGEEVTIVVRGFSAGSNVDGYDVMLGYDSDKVEIVDVESLQEEFNAIESVRSTYVSVTGFKPPEIEQDTPFDDTEMLAYTVRTLEPGEATFTIFPKRTVETTRFTFSTQDQENASEIEEQQYDGSIGTIEPQPSELTIQIQ